MADPVDTELIRRLAKLLEEVGLSELEYATPDLRVRLARPAGPSATISPWPPDNVGMQTPMRAAPAGGEARTDHPGALTSPMVGTAFLTPDPDSPPFVGVGSTVTAGETVMIIEAMKIMNAIPAHRSGTVTEILVESGQPIEFGQLLLVIE